MNSKHTPKFKALLALFLSISMLFSMVVTSFAALPEKDYPQDIDDDGVINYVTIGDSVTNGYGLAGYYFYKNGVEINTRGYLQAVASAYPELVRKYLVDAFNVEDSDVVLTQMASSGMRYNDLRFILNDSFYGDAYLSREHIGYLMSCANGWLSTQNKPGLGNDDALALLKTQYTEAIENADIISIDLGTNDFGTYLTSRLMSIVDGSLLTKPNYQDYYPYERHLNAEDAAYLKALINEMLSANLDQPLATILPDLANTLVYGLISFCSNFDAVMEEIYNLNEDVQVMVIDVYNMMAGIEMNDGTVKDEDGKIIKPGIFQGVDVSVVYDTFVDIANLYVRELSPWASKVVHVDLGKIGSNAFPELVMDYFNGFTDWDSFREKYENLGFDADFAEEEAKSIVDLFIREALGLYSADGTPEADYLKWLALKENIDLLGSIIETPKQFIHENVVFSNIYPPLNEGMDKVSAGVEVAVKGVELIGTAVNGVSMIREYMPLLTQAEDLVALIISDHTVPVLGMSLTINFSEIIAENSKDKAIKSLTTYVDLGVSMGMVPADVVDQFGGVDAVVPIIYETGYAYNQEFAKTGDSEAAVDAAIYALCVSSGKVDSETATLGCLILNAYKAAEDGNNKDAEEVTAALEAYIVDKKMAFGDLTSSELASFAYALVEVYNGEASEDEGFIAALNYALDSGKIAVPSVELFGNTVPVTGEDIYTAYKAGENASKVLFISVLARVLPDKSIANALYNIYEACVNEDLAASDDVELVLSSLGSIFGLSEDLIFALISSYKNPSDRTLSKKLAELLMQYQMGLSSDEIASNLGMYEMYFTLPNMFGQLADSTTIYLDKLFALILASLDQSAATIGTVGSLLGLDLSKPGMSDAMGLLLMSYQGDLLDSVSDKFMNNKLLLEAPDKNKNIDRWSVTDVYGFSDEVLLSVANVQYQIDATLMTIYVRFLALTGLFIHPNSVGHQVLADTIIPYLDEFVPNKADEDETFYMSGDEDKEYAVLSIGSGLALSGDYYSYKDYVSEAIGNAVLNSVCSDADLVGDFLGEVDSFETEEYDIVLLNVGAGNIKYPVNVVASAMAGAPISVPNLETIDILKASTDAFGENSIGARFDSLLGGDGMLAVAKAFMYSYADFAGNIELLVKEAVEHSPNAKIFLVGLPTLVADGSVISYNGAAFNLDLLVDKIVSDFNGHMEVIAEKYENVFYIKTSDIDNDLEKKIVLSYSDNGASANSDIATAMSEVLFEEEYHREIAKRILCDTLGIHAPSAEPNKTVAPTCMELGELHYSGCELCDDDNSSTYVIRYTEKVDHAYNDKADGFIWYDNNESADAIFECIYDCGEETVYKKATVTVEDTSTCEEAGEKIFTATIVVNDVESKEEKIVESTILAHVYDKPVWAWSEDYSEATATFDCAECDDVQVVEAEIESETTKSTCLEHGETVYTATVVFGDDKKEFTDFKTVKLEIVDHAYVDGVCKWCSTINPDKAEISTKIEDVLDSVLTEEEKDLVDEGYTVDIDLEVIDITENVPEEEKNLAEKHCGDGEVASFFDVNIYKTVNDGEPTPITETKDKIKISIKVPAEFIKDKIFYQILRIHDGKADLLDCEFDPETGRISFKTDKFSTYVLIVNDISEDGDCVYVTEEELDADGVYTMTLGGEEVGEFEFVAVDGGWTIADEDGNYLALVNGILNFGSDAFVWTFEDGMFSASETVVEEIKKGFWGGLFGGSSSTEIVETTTTYYLAAYDGILILADSGEEAEFSVKHHDDKHSYDDGVVTKPTCTDKGYTTYTCEKCGEECIYNERETIEHNYVDGECEDCGKLEDVEEPEEPEEDCIYIKDVELEEDGSYILSIGGYEVGKYTVTAVDDGWTIFDEKDETYLAVLNGILVYTDEEFVWAYDEEEFKFFYVDVQTVTSTGGFWGGLFGDSTKTETIETVYYIIPEEDKLVVSEDDELAEVSFAVIVVEEGHDYVDGICEDCGKCEDDTCVHFDAVELEENGEYVLIIGDEHLGFHTFENVEEDLWTIVNEDGDYVALEDGEIVYTSEEFVWTYDPEKSVFSVEIVTVATSGGFWGGLFGGNTSTKVETYYLVAEDGNLAVSLKDKTATAEFLVEVEGEHEYGDIEDYYGLGRSFCENCGTVKFEIAE